MTERGVDMNKIIRIVVSLLVLCSITTTMLLVGASNGPISMVVRQPLYAKDVVTVADFKGEKDKDDTDSLVKALAEAKRVNKPVFLAPGTYMISKTLNLDGQTLIGCESGNWSADSDTLPVILVTQKDSPAILMNSGTVAGINFVYNHPDSSTFEAYQEAIRIQGSNCTVINTKMTNPSKGINVTGSNIKNLRLENIFITQVHLIGVSVCGTVGKAILKNIEMWTATVTINAGSHWNTIGIGMWLGNNENLEMTDIFPFNCYEAFHFEDVNGVGTKNALMVNCSSDMTSVGVTIGGSANVTIRSGTFWNHQHGLLLKDGSSGNIVVDAAQFKSNGAESCLIQQGTGSVIFTGTMFRRTMKLDSYSTLVRIQRSNVLLNSCLLSSRFNKNENEVLQITDGLSNVEVKNCISQSTNDANFLSGGKGANIHDNIQIHNLSESIIDG
jgi:hypothetical protein